MEVRTSRGVTAASQSQGTMRNNFSFSYLAKSRCVTSMESAQEVKSRDAWQLWSMGLYCGQERHDVGDRIAVMGLLNVVRPGVAAHL